MPASAYGSITESEGFWVLYRAGGSRSERLFRTSWASDSLLNDESFQAPV